MERTAELTGLFAAHAIVPIAHGEPLAPLLGVERRDGTKTLRQLAVGNVEELIAVGQRWLLLNPERVAHGVLVYNGSIMLDGRRTDALLMEAHNYAGKVSFGMAVPYRNAGDPESLIVHKPRFMALDKPADDQQHALIEAFFRGVDQHEKGALLWHDGSLRTGSEVAERRTVLAA